MLRNATTEVVRISPEGGKGNVDGGQVPKQAINLEPAQDENKQCFLGQQAANSRWGGVKNSGHKG